jgi:hypothetical protein
MINDGALGYEQSRDVSKVPAMPIGAVGGQDPIDSRFDLAPR